MLYTHEATYSCLCVWWRKLHLDITSYLSLQMLALKLLVMDKLIAAGRKRKVLTNGNA